MMPNFTAVPGQGLPANEYNANVRDQVVTQCTQGTRPSPPATGQHIYETDTGHMRVWDGAAWVGLGTVGTPAIKTTNHTGITTETDVTDLTVTFTAAASRRYRAIVQLELASSAGSATVTLRLKEGSTTLKVVNVVAPTSPGTVYVTFSYVTSTALSAGSKTWKVSCTSGVSMAVNASATNQATLVIEDIGPL
jgi:hypothetical protein